uniref:Uncharacterized protein n=1 Tax=Ciona intestinalis TaxID=7719 RepID=H2XP34_CIOIN
SVYIEIFKAKNGRRVTGRELTVTSPSRHLWDFPASSLARSLAVGESPPITLKVGERGVRGFSNRRNLLYKDWTYVKTHLLSGRLPIIIMSSTCG